MTEVVTSETINAVLHELNKHDEPARRHELLKMLRRWLLDKSLVLSVEQRDIIEVAIEKAGDL